MLLSPAWDGKRRGQRSARLWRAPGQTGTAPASTPQGARRRYAVVLYPAESLRFLLLVQVHGVPGSKAAVTAGRVMRVVLDGDARSLRRWSLVAHAAGASGVGRRAPSASAFSDSFTRAS
jgi:hypothetical protein